MVGDGKSQNSPVPIRIEKTGLIRDKLKRKNSQAWICI